MYPTNPQCQLFRPRRFFLVFPCATAALTMAVIGWQFPIALWSAVPLIGLALALTAFGNAGLILSREGVEWYALSPKWRFRRVPWHAVLGVRRGLFGLGNRIDLIVLSGHYEPWAWGTPRRDQQRVLEIWPTALVRGDEVLEAIKGWLRRRGQE